MSHRKRKIPSETKKLITAWAKKMYTEADDTEIPDLVMDEFWIHGFEAGVAQSVKSQKKLLATEIAVFKTAILKALE